MIDMTVEDLIARFGLRPLPLEGGFFVETWRGEERDSRPAGTSILVLLAAAGDQFSALHRLPIAEVWYYHLGDPIEMLLLHPDGTSSVAWLGPDLRSSHVLQVVVPAGTWMGARVRPGGTWSLFGTSMAPGFVPADYEGGDGDALAAAYPDRAEPIRALWRPGTPRSNAPEQGPGR
jgi:predicted cupin superfamily sugar epimerase